MNTRIKLTNLAPWPVTFQRLNHLGDVTIQANGTVMVEREEVEAQLYNNNKMFVGTDGRGAHAHIIFDDKALKEQFNFPEEQNVLTDAVLDKLFAYKQQAAFERNVNEYVVRDYEKHRLIDYIQRKKVNDFSKVRYIESLVGVSVTI